MLANECVAPRCYLMAMESPEVGARFQPGQFVMVRLKDRLVPLLARPFSIHDVWADEDGRARGIKLLYKVYGKGTGLLSELGPGDEVAFWGPLGKGFSIPQDCRQFVMVAGGIGAAPFLGLGRKICEVAGAPTDSELVYMMGARSRDGLLLAGQMQNLGAKVILATEDGSEGLRGLITEILAGELQAGKLGARSMFYACGPEEMLRMVGSLSTSQGLRCEMSLESMMACGFGACYGCARKMRDPEGDGWHYELVCKDGPVFPAAKVLFD